ncbi:MAG: hypothetical protein OXG44_17770 [Gammaproteobacteria bacterium]|nr:hypothetical protein [Gammaproteobacteria bacterium]
MFRWAWTAPASTVKGGLAEHFGASYITRQSSDGVKLEVFESGETSEKITGSGEFCGGGSSRAQDGGSHGRQPHPGSNSTVTAEVNRVRAILGESRRPRARATRN